MKNITIEKKSNTYFVVTATTKRFGENEIMYEGTSLDNCLKYIKQNSTNNCSPSKLKGFLPYEVVSLIYNAIVEISKRIGCTKTSISKITRCGSDTFVHEIADKTVRHSTYKWTERRDMDDLCAVFNILTNRLCSLDKQ